MSLIKNDFRFRVVKLSIICPTIAIIILASAIILIPDPTSDLDFFYLFSAVALIGVLSVLGLISAKRSFAESLSNATRNIIAVAMLLSSFVLFLDAIFFLIVGLVGTTSTT